MKIPGRIEPRQLSTPEAIKPAATRSGSPDAGTRARHPTGGGLDLLGKMAGYAAGVLGAKLRGFSDATVQNAVTYVKSAVTNLASSLAAATFGAHATTVPPAGSQHSTSGGPMPADSGPPRAKLPTIERPPVNLPTSLAFEPARPMPQRSIEQDPGFGAAFGKWVKDNNFESVKTPAAAPTPSPVAPAPQSRLEQDPGFSAAFDKWVKDNNFESVKTPAAAPTPSPAAAPKMPESAPQASPSRLEQAPGPSANKVATNNKPHSVRTRPASPPPSQAAAQKVPEPAPEAPQSRPELAAADNKPDSARTPPAAPRPSPAAPPKLQAPAPQAPPSHLQTPGPSATFNVGKNNTASNVKTRPAAPAPRPATTSPVRQQTTPPAEDATSMLLNRKQGLSEGQSELLAAMSNLRLHQTQVKPSAPDRKDSSPAAAKPDTAATEQASPQGKVFTDPRAYARALAQWEKDNHFDYDNPMPHDYVPEPRPELRRSASADAGSPTPSSAQAAAQQKAERAAHQEALDAGYR